MGNKESPKDGHAVALNCWFACVLAFFSSSSSSPRREPALTRSPSSHSSLVYIAFVVFCTCQVCLLPPSLALVRRADPLSPSCAQVGVNRRYARGSVRL